MEKKIAVFPGSFDPLTKGHFCLVERSMDLFDEVIVAVGINSSKSSLFSVEERIQLLEVAFKDMPKVRVDSFQGLTVDYCKDKNAQFILRGLRTSADFEFERSIGQINKKLYPEIETLFLLTSPEHTPITSSIVREVLKYSGDISEFVPNNIIPEIHKILNR